ncbi:hypothetical protein L0665_01515 [Methanogenium marinum]|uniref:Uncharacterized protein n=1 Tax=Methanogenium marinum TaxID=348610 RepID=A0A9Q4PV72_9EURY|nr:hypothetical protein [Methanogenium marinum]MDE4907299.1 hypothetical protein [Methanogenium marinum]
MTDKMKDDMDAKIIGMNEKIIETHRDVKWICRTLTEMKETDENFENRIRNLEGWRAEKTGAERRMGGVCAGLSGIVGGVVAWLIQLMG